MMLTVLNWRGHCDLVSDAYFGNATTHPCLAGARAPTLATVLGMDLSQLALLVRTFADFPSKSRVNQKPVLIDIAVGE